MRRFHQAELGPAAVAALETALSKCEGSCAVEVLEEWRRGIVQYGRHYWAKREWATMRALCQQGRATATDQKHTRLCSSDLPDDWFQRIISCAYACR